MSNKLFHVTVHWPETPQLVDENELESVIDVFLVYCKNKDEAKRLIADSGVFDLVNWDKATESIEKAYPGLRIDYVEVEGAPVTTRNQAIFVKTMVE